MNFRLFFKYFIGYIRCSIANINHQKRIYIGKNVSLHGGKNISLQNNVIIRPYVDLWCNGKVSVGEGSEVGTRSRISIANELQIGQNVLISPDVYITDCDHEYRDIDIPIIKQGIVINNNKIEIGDSSYIGIHSVIVGNVKIGKHCVIGANSVITKSIPDYCVVVGSPARVIKKYSFFTAQWENV